MESSFLFFCKNIRSIPFHLRHLLLIAVVTVQQIVYGGGENLYNGNLMVVNISILSAES